MHVVYTAKCYTICTVLSTDAGYDSTTHLFTINILFMIPRTFIANCDESENYWLTE